MVSPIGILADRSHRHTHAGTREILIVSYVRFKLLFIVKEV